MNKVDKSIESTTQQCFKEFHSLVDAYTQNGINVELYTNSDPQCPDSIFPNNWVSLHKNERFPSGLIIVYKMLNPSRQKEVNYKIVAQLKSK